MMRCKPYRSFISFKIFNRLFNGNIKNKSEDPFPPTADVQDADFFMFGISDTSNVAL